MRQTISDMYTRRNLLISGMVEFPLQVGYPAYYYHGGRRVKTPEVKCIVEVALDFVCFETANTCYRIEFSPVAVSMKGKAS